MKQRPSSNKNFFNTRITCGINKLKTAKNQDRFMKLNKDILSIYDESVSRESMLSLN
jgi:hypothetical protein